MLIAAVYLVFVQSEAAWWARHGDVFLLSSARRVSTLLEEHRRSTGHYPRQLKEAPGLTEAMEELARACQSQGRGVTGAKLRVGTTAPGVADGAEVLVVYGAGDAKLLVFGGEGRVALSHDLLTRPARDLPRWASELPSAPLSSR